MNITEYTSLVIAETKKEFIYVRHYAVENIVRAINLFLLFLVVIYATAYFSGSGITSLSKEVVTFQLIGYSSWIVALSCLDIFTVAVREDSEIGVLESLALSHYGLVAIFLSRTLSRLLVDAMIVASVSALVSTVSPLDVRLHNLPLALVVLAVTIIGLYGVGFTLAGVALILKRIESVKALLSYFFLIASGVFIPVESLPAPLSASIYYLPLTLGIDLMREALLKGVGATFLSRVGWLVVLSSVYYFLGISIFKYFEKVAKKRGALAVY